MNKRIEWVVLFFCFYLGAFSTVHAQKTNDGTTKSETSANSKEKDHLEFSHPLITESISPDTKIRFTYLNTKVQSGITSQQYVLELEYSPVPVFSLHLDVPYGTLKSQGASSFSNLDNIELTLKFANFAFANHNVLLGYGIGFGLPTGNDSKGIGSDHVIDVEPFLNAGYLWRKWEWTAYFTFSVPTHQHKGENMQSSLESRATALYHLNRYWQLLAEFGNERDISSPSGWNKNYDLLEGFKYLPFGHKPWILGAAVRQGLGKNSDLHFQWLLTLFYHFRD
ncbi:MAG TPA: hypothetical protein VFI29_00750 [Hanamia sp.]|nr:hypothetical protein [Hanamia sp.]